MESTLCVDQDVKEDEYDAFNDETFGDAGGDDAWEEGHDVLAAQLEETIKLQQHSAQHIEDLVNTSISQLGLDEEVRNFTSQPPAAGFPQPMSGYALPQAAGHPTPVPLTGAPVMPSSTGLPKGLSILPGAQQAAFGPRAVLRPPLMPPTVMSAEQLEKQMLQESRRLQAPAPAPAPPPPLNQVKTLEELESEMFFLQQQQQMKQKMQQEQLQRRHQQQLQQQQQQHQHHMQQMQQQHLQQMQQQQQQQQQHIQQVHQQQQLHLHQAQQLNSKPLSQEPHPNHAPLLQHMEPQVSIHNGFRPFGNRAGGPFPQKFNERYSDFPNVPVTTSPMMNNRFRYPQPHPNQFQRGPDFRDQRFREQQQQGHRDYRRDDGRYSEQRGDNRPNSMHSPNDFHERNSSRYNMRDVETFGFDAVHEYRQEQEIKAATGPRSDDPYSGLMTDKEKDFVIRVQMLSLNMQCPQEQDYYYLEFMKRKSQGKAVCRNKLLTQRIQRVADKPHEPQQFENSLGKLHSTTAHAPKKILDMAGSRKLDDGDGRTVPANTDLLLFRKLLMDTERGFNLVLKIEDPEVLTSRDDKILAGEELSKKLVLNPEYLLGIRKGRLLVLRSIGALWKLGGHRDSCIRLLCSLFDNLELILLRQKGLGDAVFIEKLDIIDDVLRECLPEDIERLQKCMKKYEAPGNDIGQWILACELGQMITDKLRESASRR